MTTTARKPSACSAVLADISSLTSFARIEVAQNRRPGLALSVHQDTVGRAADTFGCEVVSPGGWRRAYSFRGPSPEPRGMLVELGLFVGGLVILVVGADRLIEGAGELALYYGLSAFFVGVTVVSIGPTPSLAAALQDDPEIAESCRFVGMHGSFYRGYDGDEEPSAEANVRIDPDAFRAVLDAPWRDVLLTPLDTCGLVTLTGDRYNRVWRSTDDPLVRSVIESNCVFAPRVPWWPYEDFTRQSSTLFDSVAVYLAVDESFVETRTEIFDVTDDGFTEPDSDGEFEARIALEWRDLDAFEAYLVDVLLEA